MKHQNITSWY